MTEHGDARGYRPRPMVALGFLLLVLGGLRVGLHDGTVAFPQDALLVPPEALDPDDEEKQLFSETLLELRRLTADNRTQLAFALLPTPLRRNQPPRRDEHERLPLLLADHGLPFVDLRSDIKQVDSSEHQVHPAAGHPGGAIHQAMAELVLKRGAWDLWLQECPPGTKQVVKKNSETGAFRLCLTEAGTPQGPYQQEQDGYVVASGRFEGGQRSGPWMEASQQISHKRFTRSAPAAVLERGDYAADKREGLWREFVLSEEELMRAQQDGVQVGWLEALRMPDLWSRLGSGRYAAGERTGRWTWIGTTEQAEEGLLEVRCYEAGELVWTWMAKLGLDEEDDGRGDGLRPETGEGPEEDRNDERGHEDHAGQDQDEHQGDENGLLEGNSAAEENCSDRLDDDGDGATDCDDLDCSNDPACRHLLPAVGGPDEDDDDSAEPESIPSESEGALVDTPSPSRSPGYPVETPAGSRDKEAGRETDGGPLVILPEETIHYWDRGPATPRNVVSVPASRAWNFQCP